jgi:hypothetical protein
LLRLKMPKGSQRIPKAYWGIALSLIRHTIRMVQSYVHTWFNGGTGTGMDLKAKPFSCSYHITSCEHLLADSQFMFCRWSQSHSCFGGQRCWCQCTRWFWPRGEVMPSPLVVPIQGLCRLEG